MRQSQVSLLRMRQFQVSSLRMRQSQVSTLRMRQSKVSSLHMRQSQVSTLISDHMSILIVYSTRCMRQSCLNYACVNPNCRQIQRIDACAVDKLYLATGLSMCLSTPGKQQLQRYR